MTQVLDLSANTQSNLRKQIKMERSDLKGHRVHLVSHAVKKETGGYHALGTLPGIPHLSIKDHPHRRLHITHTLRLRYIRHRTVITIRTMESGKTRKRGRSDLQKSHRAHPVSHAVNKGTGEYPALRTLLVERQIQPWSKRGGTMLCTNCIAQSG